MCFKYTVDGKRETQPFFELAAGSMGLYRGAVLLPCEMQPLLRVQPQNNLNGIHQSV